MPGLSSWLLLLCAVCCSWCCCISMSEGTPLHVDPWRHYENVHDADEREAWELVQNLKLVYYQYKYDKRVGRRQLGVMPSELQRAMPGAVTRRPMPVTLQNGRKITVEGVPSVDWAALFMLSVAATRYLHGLWQEAALESASLQTYFEGARERLSAVRQLVSSSIPSLHLAADANMLQKRAELLKNLHTLEMTRHEQELVTLDWQVQEGITTGALALQLYEQLLKLKEEKMSETGERVKAVSVEESVKQEMLRRNTSLQLIMEEFEVDREIAAREADALLFSRRQAWAAEAEEKRTEAISSLARIAAKGEEDRAKMRAAIGAFFQALADALASVLVQSGSWGFALAILSFSLAILLARHGMGLLSQLLEHWLTRPSLIRDTSRMNFCAEFVAAIFLRSFGGRRDAKQRASAGEGLGPGVILGVAEEQRLLEVVSAVRGAQEHGVELQHLLLSGAPGTGKTMVARRLADLCDLDYAILSGADLGPLGTRAAAEVHRLMAWAQSSPRGMLLLIDEAEAIAPSRRRRSVRLGEAAVGALNALMYNTGAVGSRFMLVMATSRPEDLDEGILDRMDHAVELSLPGSADRLRLCKYYFSLYFTGQGPARRNRNFFGSRRARPIVCAPDWDADVALADLAGRSEGLSGREVDKILLAVQAAVYGTEDCTLTGELWRLVIERQLANAKAKKALQNGEDPEAAAPMDQEPEVVPLRSSPSPESTATRTRSRRVCVHIF